MRHVTQAPRPVPQATRREESPLRPIAAAALSLLLAGCATISPVQRRVDPDTLPSCTRACQQVGMRLSAIVFVSEFGGCV